MITLYRITAHRWTIERVQADRVSEKFLWPAGSNQRQALHTSWDDFYFTHAEAKAALMERASADVRRAEHDLDRARRAVARVFKLDPNDLDQEGPA